MAHESSFIILLDALRHDYVSAEHSPYLFTLKQRAVSAQVIETFAFQTRPAYFAGLEPEESDICHLYERNPECSPFSFLRCAPGLCAALDRLSLDGVVRGPIRRLAKRREQRCGRPASAAVMSTAQIPLRFLPCFSLCEAQFTDSPNVFGDHRTIFDHFRRVGLTWNWIGYPRDFGSTESILRRYADSPRADVVYLHFSELDWLGHKHGPATPEVFAALTRLDATLRSLLEPAVQRGAKIVIFGDHGMVQVQHRLDIEACLRALPLSAPGDYLYFLDSTQARFWFFSDRARTLVTAALQQLTGGHIVSDAERSALHINFRHSRFGELIYMLHGGHIIHPSFFDRSAEGPHGMHGYLPDVHDNRTQVMAVAPHLPPGDRGTISMREIFPLMLQAFDLTDTDRR